MSYITFVIIALFCVIAYYVWVIFFYRPDKPIQIDEIEEEAVEFIFDSPIKVSEQFINKIRTKHEAPQSTLESTKSSNTQEISQKTEASSYLATPQVQNQTIEAEKEELTLGIGIALETGKKLLSRFSLGSPAPSGAGGSELEYFSFSPINLLDISREGRGMFAHIPLG